MTTKKERRAAAQMLGKRGGMARKHKLTPERRKEIAIAAGRASWQSGSKRKSLITK